jgi:hypothetical protein
MLSVTASPSARACSMSSPTPREARLGCERRDVVAQRAEDASHVAEGGSRGIAYRHERPLDELRVVRERSLRSIGLDRDHAHRVGDLVVQLPRNPRPLLCDGGTRPLVTFPLELQCELL